LLVDDRGLCVAFGEDLETRRTSGRMRGWFSLPSLNVATPPLAEEVVSRGSSGSP